MAEQSIPVRLSHLLRHCSVGAIVRGPDSLFVVPDIREWGGPGDDPLEREIRYVDQVRSSLEIDERLCRPPVAVEKDRWRSGWIKAPRFPGWMRCLKCGLLHYKPWNDRERGGESCWDSAAGSGNGARIDGERGAGTGSGNELGSGSERGAARLSARPTSDGCGGRLEQVPWVLVHKDGYLADVPWHDLAHAGSAHRGADGTGACRRDWREPYLVLLDGEDDRSSRRPAILCSRCRSRGELASRLPFASGVWQQPWLREGPAESPVELAWIMEINDVRVHSPVTVTALVIPPESRIRRGTPVDRLYSSSRHRQRIRNARNLRARTAAIRRLSGEYGCTPTDIEAAILEIDRGYPLYGQSISGEDLRKSEFGALTDRIPDLRDDEDFVTRHCTPAWKALRGRVANGIARRAIDAVDRLVAVVRLKEIMVFRGFSRAGGDRLPPDIVRESDWLPAVELHGEGIFFTLDEMVLARWEASTALHDRTDAFTRRYYQSELQDRPPDVFVTPRLLLCHTLAHLLIRKLEAEAGYPAASLKERLYCADGSAANAETRLNEPAADVPMAGILIYVAVADEEGSLGGLAELAEPERFLRLLTGALEEADWCSLDPVCGEREGHGPGLLNGAACHACALLPETSCEHGNILLDRTFVKGDGGEIPALLDCVPETP